MPKRKPKLAIATSFDKSWRYYVLACKHLGINYEVFDILAPDWLSFVKNSDADGYLLRPPCDFEERKAIYDERVWFLAHEMGKPIYPSFKELYIYENKRNVATWLDIHEFPHPKTHIFSRKEDAFAHFEECAFPIVVKSNIGSSGRRVEIVKTRRKARAIAREIFGLVSPDLARGHAPLARVKRKSVPLKLQGAAQRHSMLVQEYHELKWEWRMINIGDFYFGHQKLLLDGFASGSKMKGWLAPPVELLEMLRKIMETGGFHSMAVDIFETKTGEYLVNEMQSLFGFYLDYQMKIDDIEGAYVREGGEFRFKPGNWNFHGSYPLRVHHFLQLLGFDPPEFSPKQKKRESNDNIHQKM